MAKIFYWYLFGIVCVFLYSFTQVDLGLALTRFPSLFAIQRAFQSVGYFNRPLSAILYVFILLLLFVLYGILLSKASKHQLKRADVWKTIIVTTVILTFSYNAFSHDLFNYIFDAKIFTVYGKNPYFFKALDFPSDPMLGFMHWTHRVYPYGPIWLILTIPLSFFSFNKFILSFIFFKALMSVSFLGVAYCIEKIFEKTEKKDDLLPLVFFAFNPFILIESLISAHNDIVMLFFCLAAFLLLFRQKYFLAILFFIISVGIKFATIFLAPIFLVTLTLIVMQTKIPWKSVFSFCVGCMLLAVLAAAQRSGNFQAWYLLYVFVFIPFLIRQIIIPGFLLGVGASLLYIPYLLYGNWDAEVQMIMRNIEITTLIFVLVASILLYIKKREGVTNHHAAKK